jgi:catechol 2,3-dioxygenase-like lactoylglutathione lyase family enzyme
VKRSRLTAASLLCGGVLLALGGTAQDRPPRPRITGINHVAYRIADAAAARGFYHDVLGLPERAGSRPHHTAYTIGRRQHILLEAGLEPGQEERLSHVAFETPDVPALAAYFAARGLSVGRPPERCGEDAIRVSDPDGHPIEFVQAVWPPESGSADRGRAPAPSGVEALSTRLLHAGLIVSDEEAAHRFYRDVLGFSEIWRGGRVEGTTDWINMRVPDGTDYLEYMLRASAPDRRQRGVLHHACLLVPDVQAAWEKVVARTPAAARDRLAPPNVGRNGRWQLNLYDPDGTRTELMEPYRIR